ncbi:hypothetical protein TrCOL_g5475 [Triparma columacea]|nr:hypothetical protein TrCOL_g5475 [Triparma columacea]
MSDPTRRRGPDKYKYLSVFTIFQSLLVAMFTAFFPSRMVVSAAMTTAVGVGGVTIATVANKNPKYDLTQMGQGIMSVTSVFVGYSIINLLGRLFGFKAGLPWNELLMCSVGAGIASAWLGYHTSLIVGGSHSKYKMHEDDYVFGAVAVYNDIINLFIYILRIMAETQRSKD